MNGAPLVDRRISVRRFARADSSFVERLSERAFSEYSAHPGRYVLSLVQRTTTRAWVALAGEQPVGMAMLELGSERASLLAIAVDERSRGRGIGRRLMQAVEQGARADGARLLSLCTADSNLAALDLFLRCEMRIVGRKPGYYSRRQDACELEKRL